jgi:hypothetical protein
MGDIAIDPRLGSRVLGDGAKAEGPTNKIGGLVEWVFEDGGERWDRKMDGDKLPAKKATVNVIATNSQ